MDVTNQKVEQSASQITSWIKANLGYLDVNEATFMHINTKESYIHAWPTHYEWHLSYWDNDLDLQLHQRLQTNHQTWNELSQEHQQVLYRQFHQTHKTDISIYYDGIYEILSVHTQQALSPNAYVVLKQALHALSHQAAIKRKQNKVEQCFLPLRDHRIRYLNQPQHGFSNTHLFTNNKNFSIQGIRFTGLELETIHHLMLMRTYKEIAFIYQCSETAIRKRILNIKRKNSVTLLCQRLKWLEIYKP